MGLSPDADLIYRMLTTFGPQTVTGAARELGLAPHRVRTALEELAAIGAARPGPSVQSRAGHPSRRSWVPAPADRVLATVRLPPGRPWSAAERWRRHLGAVDGIDLVALDPDLVRRLPSRDLVRRRIADLVRAERHEQVAINTEQVFSAAAAAAALPLDRDLRARGVRLMSLGLPPSDGDRSAPDLGDDGLGGDYRESDALPLKLIVFDRRVAIFPADPLDFEAGAIEVADPAVVDQFTRLFHRLWATGRDPRRDGVPPLVLSSRESAVVGLLAAGHSEEFAAGQLGISRRTVIYCLRALMDRLGVENRFQLALLLGAHRAVPVPGLKAPGSTA